MEKRNLEKRFTKSLDTSLHLSSLGLPPQAPRRRSQSLQPDSLPSTNSSSRQTTRRQHNNTSGITHRPLIQRKLSGFSKEKSSRRTFDRKPRRIQSMNGRQQSTTPGRAPVIKRSNSYAPRSKRSTNIGLLDLDTQSHTDIWIECLLFRFKEKPRKYFKSINTQICLKNPPIWGGDVFYLDNVMEQDEESYIEITMKSLSEIPFDVSEMQDTTTKQSSKKSAAAATKKKKKKNNECGRMPISEKLKALVKILIRSKKVDHI